MKPMGHFTMDYHSQNKRHVVMVTGGSGITPIMGITKSLLVNEPNSKTTLLYCSRSEDQIIFKDQLLALEDKYPDKLRVIHNLTQPTANWTGLKGRIDSERINDVLMQSVYPEAEKTTYLTCGPQGLMETFLTTLEGLGVDQENVIRESFFKASINKTADTETISEPGLMLTREVKVILEGEEYEFEVSPNQTILEAGLKEEVDMPYSCQSGLCTSCRGKLLSGEVKMDEDAGLSENELKQGYILCCVSHPVSGDVKINIE